MKNLTSENLDTYIKEHVKEGLDQIVVTLKNDADEYVTESEFYVDKTKETYVFVDEQEADAKIDEVRQLDGFTSAKKKFKAGKVSKKDGEEISPDTWTVVVELMF